MKRLHRLFSTALSTIAVGVPALAQVVGPTIDNIPVGDVPTAIASVDLNGDNLIDLVIANRDSSTLSVLLNPGDGDFTSVSPQNVTVGTRPFFVFAAFIDSGSVPDLAVALEGADQVAVLLGAGGGALRSPVTYNVGDSPRVVRGGNFNSDSALDLITSNENDDTVSILINAGNGTFATAVSITVDPGEGSRPRPKSVAVGDFNKDGFSDFAVANLSRNSVSVRLNDGAGSFEAIAEFQVGSDPWALIAADVNNDGKLDLVSANQVGDNVTVLLGDGAGDFESAGDFDAGNGPVGIAAADFNSDGFLDLVTANSEGDNVSMLLGNGDGSFDAPKNYDTGNFPAGVAAADLDADTEPDIATANEEADNVTVVLLGGGLDLPEIPSCAAPSCGPLGLGPTFLTMLGIVGLKRFGRRTTL